MESRIHGLAALRGGVVEEMRDLRYLSIYQFDYVAE
jgi:hypothetical protein